MAKMDRINVFIPGSYGHSQAQVVGTSPEELKPHDLVEVHEPVQGGYGSQTRLVEVRDLRPGDRVSGSHTREGAYGMHQPDSFEVQPLFRRTSE